MTRVALVLMAAALAVAALAGAAHAAPGGSLPAPVKTALVAGGLTFYGGDVKSGMAASCVDTDGVRRCKGRLAMRVGSKAEALIASGMLSRDLAFRERIRKEIETELNKPGVHVTLVGGGTYLGRYLLVTFKSTRTL